jgi:site-specific DNA-methyltransferase (adenine-specific)
MSRWTLEPGDCRDVLLELAAGGAQFDSCVTDPPYHLTSVVKRFGKAGAAPAKHGTDGLYARQSRGFMGKEWDGGDVAFDPETWRLVGGVLKPGGHVLAFGGSRTFHRMAVAIEDAGFEIRDCVMWVYGTGFPKSHDVSKGIDKAAGAERNPETPDEPATPEAAQWQGWGTALKPSFEPVIVARKPLIGTVAENVLAHGTGALNIDGCRIALTAEADPSRMQNQQSNRVTWEGGAASGFKADHAQPLFNQDGRWPANLIHDGSPEVLAAFGAYGERGAAAPVRGDEPSDASTGQVTGRRARVAGAFHADTGTAARFFYSAKASKADRFESKHPTIKPIDLIRYLTRLVTPPGGHVLDPFAGSGTLIPAAHAEGFSATVIEMDPEYQGDIRRRIAALGVSAPDPAPTPDPTAPVDELEDMLS